MMTFLRRMLHWGPLLAIMIIKIITLTSLYYCNMWWPPHDSLLGFLHVALFTMWNAVILYNFLSAMLTGPGFVPLGWKPAIDDDCQYLQFCKICNGYKAPRAHHCKTCKRCVLKMDHHCPWINSCVGHFNHASFILFLVFAVFGCIHASIILGCASYRGIHRRWYLLFGDGTEPIVYVTVYTLILGLFALGLAVGVVIAVGALSYFQLKSVVRNITGIEEWILRKSERSRMDDEPPFVYPYNLGWWRNIGAVFNYSMTPVGDGLEWVVRDGCHKYALTIEQINQKHEKKFRTIGYSIIEDYNGYMFPLFSKGLWITLNFPCSEEQRVRLAKGDMVRVTRWKKHWLYGEVHSKAVVRNGAEGNLKGWFPRRCAVEVFCNDQAGGDGQGVGNCSNDDKKNL